jgi:glutaredoxin
MTLFERAFYGLERLEAEITRAVKVVRERRDRAAATDTLVNEALARHVDRSPKDMTPSSNKPLGDPSIAIQIYGRRSEPWTGRALLIVRDQDLPHAFIDLDTDDGRLHARLQSETRQDVQPYVFIRGEFIGGYNALDELNRLGTLEEAIRDPHDRGNTNGPVVVVPRRGPEQAPPGERG